jgi:hypothetical protein
MDKNIFRTHSVKKLANLKYIHSAEEHFHMQFGKIYFLLWEIGYPGLIKGYSKIPCSIKN